MSREREPMRKIKEVLRLAEHAKLSVRQIACSANMKRTTVRDYLRRARDAGLRWSDAKELGDEAIEQMLFPALRLSPTGRTMPDWEHVHTERRRPHVTLRLLWEEYRTDHPDGYGYTQFCEHYRRYTAGLEVSMRQDHKAGEKLFVDYSGGTMPVVDARTGEVREAEIFVAVLGASSYSYAEATWSQQLPDWIGAHTRALSFFGGVPELIVPDNLKSGVTKASYYDPEINPTYQHWADHYAVAILPTRVRHPKDKPKVESGVQVVQRWILARLRNRTFFSLEELNEAIAMLLEDLNTRPLCAMRESRSSLFERLDRTALRSLPIEPYELDEWRGATVNVDYHVSFEDHFYSVPHGLVRQHVEVRATASIIEIYHRGKRVAVHTRSDRRYGHSTISGHMPSAHRWYAEWTPQRMLAWGTTAGSDVERLFETIMASKRHPEQGFRSCLGIMRLGKKVGKERLNAACRRALAIQGASYSCVRHILDNGQEMTPLQADVPPMRVINHDNVRGAGYYRSAACTERAFDEQLREECHVATSHL